MLPPVSTLARTLALFLAVALACVCPKFSHAASGGGGQILAAAKSDPKLVFAVPERGAQVSCLVKPSDERPVWFDRVTFSSSLIGRSKFEHAAIRRVEQRTFRPKSLVGTVELRI